MAHDEFRALFEWLGLVEPDRSRREPIAVPRWAPYAVAAIIVAVAALGAVAIEAALGLQI